MGSELMCKCQKCGYFYAAFVGIGMLYAKTYSETVTQIKEGKFGEQGKEFLEAFPDGAISCRYIVVQCNDCKELMTVPELSLYVPKEGYNPVEEDKNIPWSTAFSGRGYEYVPITDLDEHYQLFEKYDHRCSRCNGHTSVVSGFTGRRDKNIDRRVCCPKCGSIARIDLTGHWD